ncbi:glutamate racemase [Paenibacillus alvei]|uniref:Glutamate racemase n=1 Tax=Paenibacillus alvei TaxID=44250 RepID=A0ABT4GY81_PAEAL|nr:glutamate racemase [Paenibacillus alvei]MCY9761670.1 glutamate racemase [Paenibacillus alvei]MCY9769711.1 glutamate racemase [Paenibacillus alvei]
MTISFFDSGMGGITVLAEAMKQLPQEQYLFYADTLHVPYGTKSQQEVMRHVQSAVEEIMQHHVKALVIACNTATSIAASELRRNYNIPIIGMEPAVKPAVEMNRNNGKRVLVFATALTLSQDKYHTLVTRLDEEHIVDSIPLPELVEYCEQLNFDKGVIGDFFAQKLAGIDLSQYGTIVLGCTHYPYYKHILREIVPDHIQLIDGSQGTVQRLAQVLQEKQLNQQSDQTTSPTIQFMCSSHDQQYINKLQIALHTYQTFGGMDTNEQSIVRADGEQY